MLSTLNLEHSLQLAVKNGGHDSLLAGDTVTLNNIATAAREGDKLSKAALQEYGRILSVLTMSVINFFNPEMIILGGPVIDKCPFVFDEAKKYSKGDDLSVPADVVTIKAGALKNRAGTLGAVGMVLQDLFKPPIVNLATYRSLISPE